MLFVGFPGQAAAWFENPFGSRAAEREPGHWKRHLVVPAVDNESPTFLDLTGDGEPELVFHTGGRLGWAAPDPDDPRTPWTFHAISDDVGLPQFTHGLGVGDVDGDGRNDLLEKTGWWRQPESLTGDPLWEKHPFRFAGQGGAQMFVTDVDGDGDGDVITSKEAHGWGLSWFEHVRGADGIDFVEHEIMTDDPDDNPWGLRFSQLHALALRDVDSDGLPDVVTGKRHWAHGPEGDPQPNAPAVVYWFGLERRPDGPRFVPHLIDDDSGVGVQVVAGDVDGDGRDDVVIGNKKGTFVLLQRTVEELAGAEEPQAPDERSDHEEEGDEGGGYVPRGEGGRQLNLDFERGDLSDWTAAGTAFEGQPVRGDTVSARDREPSLHAGDYWIGGYELQGDGPTGTLRSTPFVVTEPWASFLVGGGNHDSTRVELFRAGSEGSFFMTSAANYESMQRVVVDLEEHAGERIFVQLSDEHTGGWGHLNFDDFRFHAREPSFEPSSATPPVLQRDETANAGLLPGEAATAMSVPPGFQVELVAGEPDVHQPIALALDARGRLWIAEAHCYPERRPDGEGEDHIVVFEDTDADGAFDRRTVFADDLNLVSGLEVGFGGVWVGAAPYLYFIPDRDDDLVPDGPPEVLLDGWAYQDTHETLNAFNWGPDGWLYGCHGVFTHSRVGAPGTPDDERVPLNAGVWRYHPTRHEFEVFAWGSSNPWGVDFDDDGQAFITACVIPHLYHVIQGARYQRQAGSHFNPYVYADIQTIADHRHYVGSTPHGGNQRSNVAGGGHAHCGAMVYLGGSFPDELRNALFMNNIHGNRVNVDRMVRSGSGFVGEHADDFLLANDGWFRGINLRYGPEGSVYLIDWYDEQACHDRSVERWNRTNGRVYRVGYGDHWPLVVNLPSLPDDELVRLQMHENDWFVRQARKLLQERGGSNRVRGLLESLLRREWEPRKRLRALWALHAVEGLREPLVHELLDDEEEYIRAWTIQLVCEGGVPPRRVLERLVELAERDGSPVVRLYLAAALQRLPLNERWDVAERLVAHAEDAGDHNIPLVLWYGVEPLVPADPSRALALARSARIELVARHIVRRAASERALLEELVRAMRLERDRGRRAWMLEELDNALHEERNVRMPPDWPALYAQLACDSDPAVRERAVWLGVAFGDESGFPELRRILADTDIDLPRREQALDALLRGKDRRSVSVLHTVLGEPALRGRALRALATFDDPDTPRVLLSRYAELDADERRDALNTLSSRREYARELLRAVGAGVVARDHLSAFVLRNLANLDAPEIDELVSAHWGLVRDTSAEAAERITKLSSELDAGRLAGADLPNGRRLFARNCEQCHTLFGTGGTLGPDITGSNRADVGYLLTTVIDPNAVIGRDYRATNVWLSDGRIVTGLERRRSETAVTIQTENDTVVVPLDEVDEIELSELSTMPEGLFDHLQADEIRDLVAYLGSPSQVPMRATEETVGRFFDGESLAGWVGNPDVWSVVDGEIVGLSNGLERNEFLRSELELGDFRLRLEVRLAGNEGNSGIQFRSRSHGDEVAGYQADIGVGWWGKLYEEHGREVLADGGGEQHVVVDGWNTYEILAVGHRVRTWLNGELCVDLDDPEGATRGFVALQLHSGGATEVRFRDFELVLDPEAGLASNPPSDE